MAAASLDPGVRTGSLLARSGAATPAPRRLPPQLCAARAGLGEMKGQRGRVRGGAGRSGAGCQPARPGPAEVLEGTGTRQVRRRRLQASGRGICPVHGEGSASAASWKRASLLGLGSGRKT